MMISDYGKPFCGKLNDGVEFSLQGSWALAHLNVLAVFSDWRIDLSLGPGLSLLQTQKFGGRWWNQQGLGTWQRIMTCSKVLAVIRTQAYVVAAEA